MLREAAKQPLHVLWTPFAEITQQRLQVVRRKGRRLEQARIVAVLARQHGERDAGLAGQRRQGLDAIAPPVEPTQKPHHDNLRVPRHRVDPQIDGHGMAQVAQMREPHGWQRVALHGIRGGKPGKIAIGKRQHHDIARRLAEIDRLDDVVERRGAGLQEMHARYPASDLATASRSRPLRPMTTTLPWRISDAPQGRS